MSVSSAKGTNLFRTFSLPIIEGIDGPRRTVKGYLSFPTLLKGSTALVPRLLFKNILLIGFRALLFKILTTTGPLALFLTSNLVNVAGEPVLRTVPFRNFTLAVRILILSLTELLDIVYLSLTILAAAVLTVLTVLLIEFFNAR